MLRKAQAWHALLASGEVGTQADIARREGITRARVTQVMGMLHLAPGIQQHILAMPQTARRPAITERVLRPISGLENLQEQLATFQKLM